MEIRELGISGVFEITPRQHPDDRGVFLELYKAAPFAEAVGHPLTIKQANYSVSSAGTVRGIHFADVPPSQAKYVACFHGAILDVAVDIRVGSPTYGAWEAVRLDTADRRALYLSEGIGHAFMALTDDGDGGLPGAPSRTPGGASTACTRSTRRSASSGRAD